MKLWWKILGTCLIAYSHLHKSFPVRWLGYYLQGTGKTRTLPDELLENSNRFQRDFNTNRHWTRLVSKRDSRRNSYYTVGKVKLRPFRGGWAILDYYIFYPVCTQSNIHGRGCKCESQKRTWNRVTVCEYNLPTKISRFITGEWYAPSYNNKFNINMKLAGWEISIYDSDSMSDIDISVCDKYFENKGKPFYSVGVIQPKERTSK
jgi:hypothetical protein